MLCRLCVKESVCFLNIFDSDGMKLDIAEILGRHFWFKPRADDRMPPAICTMCWSKVYNFHQFYVTIELAHSRLSASSVEKEFIGEYVGNEFTDEDIDVKEEFTFSAIENGNVFVGLEFSEIGVSAKELPESAYSKKTKRGYSVRMEIDRNGEEFPADPCSYDTIQEEQNNVLMKQAPIINACDGINEEYDKLHNEYLDSSLSRCNGKETLLVTKNCTKAIKHYKNLKATEIKVFNLKEKGVVKAIHNKNNISADGSSSQGNVSEPPLTNILIKPVKNQKRTTTKKRLSKLREKRSSDAQEPALEKYKEPISDASLSYPEMHNYTEHVDESLSNCDALELTAQKSIGHIEDASSHCDPLEPEVSKYNEPITDASKKCTKSAREKSSSNGNALDPSERIAISAKNRRRLNSTEKRITKLREKRGVNSTYNDDELVKKYIPMRCDMCIFDCEEFEALKNHYRADHPNTKPYVKCCNRKWAHWMEIVHHAYKHDDPELLKCQECHKDFNDVGTLSRHITDFHAPEEDKIFSCDFCSKKFARQKRLEIHRNLHIPLNERPFICDKCPNSRFASEALLRVHNRNTHRRAHFVCHVCAKKIKTKAFFEKHVRLHFEESGPKVKCTFENCDSWLKDEDNLRLHIRRAHNKNKDKIFTCGICGGEYKSRASVTSHMLRVHPKKTFPCDICNKNFKKEWTLREHMAQHTGEKNYQCPFCTSTFNVTGNFYSHLKNMHATEYENWRKNNLTANKKILIKVKS